MLHTPFIPSTWILSVFVFFFIYDFLSCISRVHQQRMELGPIFSSQRRLRPRSSCAWSRYHDPRVPVTASCVRLLHSTQKQERERGRPWHSSIPAITPCKHDLVLSYHTTLFSFICPSSSASLVVCGTGRALTSVAPVAHRTQSAPPPSRWHVSFDLPPLFPPSIFCPRQIIVWLGSLDHLGLEVQRRNIHVLALVALPVPLFS